MNLHSTDLGLHRFDRPVFSPANNVLNMFDYLNGGFKFGVGNKISYFQNLGTPSNPFNQLVGANQGLLEADGVSFVNTECMASPLVSGLGNHQAVSYLAVWSMNGTGEANRMVETNDLGSLQRITVSNKFRTSFTDENITASTANSADQFYISSFVYDNPTMNIYLNGVLDKSVASFIPPAVDQVIELMQANTSNSYKFKGLLMDNTAWDAATHDMMVGWAAWRYGLVSELDASQAYKNRRP